MMRFRILHLMIFTLIVAAILSTIEFASFRTVTILFSSPQEIVPGEFPALPIVVLPSSPDEEIEIPELDSTPKEYSMVFSVMEAEDQKFRTVRGEFGFNELIGSDIQLDSISELDGCSCSIRYRRYSLPWASAETVDEVVGRHFEELTPHVDYWPGRPANCWMFSALTLTLDVGWQLNARKSGLSRGLRNE